MFWIQRYFLILEYALCGFVHLKWPWDKKSFSRRERSRRGLCRARNRRRPCLKRVSRFYNRLRNVVMTDFYCFTQSSEKLPASATSIESNLKGSALFYLYFYLKTKITISVSIVILFGLQTLTVFIPVAYKTFVSPVKEVHRSCAADKLQEVTVNYWVCTKTGVHGTCLTWCNVPDAKTPGKVGKPLWNWNLIACWLKSVKTSRVL